MVFCHLIFTATFSRGCHCPCLTDEKTEAYQKKRNNFPKDAQMVMMMLAWNWAA